MKIIPRFVDLPPLLIAGMREPMSEQSMRTIPVLWQKFRPYINKIPHQTNAVAYGLCVCGSKIRSGDFYYMAGCEVSEFTDLPAELSPSIVPAHTYAVFPHAGHVSEIRAAIDYIFDQWLPTSDYEHHSDSIHFFERYAQDFDPAKGVGGIEIWLPLKRF